MRLSIVACDPHARALGAAVAGDGFATVGCTVEVRAGLGVVAQLGGPDRWAGVALDRLGEGRRADHALDELADREDAADAQLALVDAGGQVGAFTGSQCRSHAGHAVAEGVVVQAVGSTGQDAWTVPLEAYRRSPLPLARRLLVGLAAAVPHAALGVRTASLLVVGPQARIDLRVDDAAQALAELARLIDTDEAHRIVAAARTPAGGRQVSAADARRILALAPEDPVCLGGAAEILALGGEHAEAQRLVARLPMAHAQQLAQDLKVRAAHGELSTTAHFYALLRALHER